MYSSYGFSSIAATAGIGLVLMVLAFIAAIVVTVLLYRKYISAQKPVRVPGTKRDWGPFFRFENLIVEKILQALFIFTACLIAFESAASIITSIVGIAMYPYGAGGAVISIIIVLIIFVVLEVINRIGFEFSIMTVLICKNTTAIRSKVCGDTPQPVRFAGDDAPEEPEAPAPRTSAPADPHRYSRYNTQQYTSHPTAVVAPAPVAPSPAENPAPIAPPAGSPVNVNMQNPPSPVPTQADTTSEEQSDSASTTETEHVDTVSEAETKSSSWTCEQCGHTNQSGKFCSQCGNPRD